MWVYSSEQALRHRFSLDPGVALWLDQWLALLTEDVHPCWAARPLGLSALGELVNNYVDPEHDRRMIQQTRREAERLLPSLQLGPLSGAPTVSYLNRISIERRGLATWPKEEWRQEWKLWFRDLSDSGARDRLADFYLEHLFKAIDGGQGHDVLNWTKLVVQELLAGGRSSRGLLEMALVRFVPVAPSSSGQKLDWKEAIKEIVKPSHEQEFEVELAISPTFITRRVQQQIIPPQEAKLCFDPSGALVSVLQRVMAPHREDASAKAFQQITKFLAGISAKHHIRPPLTPRKLQVSSAGNSPRQVPLPQPFWSRGPGKRRIPSLPARFARIGNCLTSKDRERWDHSRHLFEQSVASWDRDIHGAATLVWEALETMMGTNDMKELRLSFQRLLPQDILGYMAAKFSLQCDALQRFLPEHRGKSPWSFFEANQWNDAKDWLQAILTPNTGMWYYRNWPGPSPPPFLFDADYGRLCQVWRFLTSSSPVPFNTLKDDLDLLYGLRNGFNHNGNLGMPSNLAAYLGRVGLELLLRAMTAVAQHVHNSNRTGVSIRAALT